MEIMKYKRYSASHESQCLMYVLIPSSVGRVRAQLSKQARFQSHFVHDMRHEKEQHILCTTDDKHKLMTRCTQQRILDSD